VGGGQFKNPVVACEKAGQEGGEGEMTVSWLMAGSAISSGLFVPMLMMGATVGRLVGW
jgi:hypothetical protein